MKFSICVVIPVLNPQSDFFDEIIPLIEKQNIPNKIVLISSGGRLLEGAYQTITINKSEFNHANTRNLALWYDADFYLFMTQDATPFNENLIENLLKPFIDDDIVVSYARQIPYENAHITEKFARGKNYPEISMIKSKEGIKSLGIKTFFSSDSCAMYRGDYFKKVGGFKRDLNVSEDMEFAYRAIMDGKKVAYCAEAKVYHSHVYTLWSLYKRYFTIGRFFKENGRIQESIKESISTQRTGANQVAEELKYVALHQPSALFKSFVYNLTKFIAYSLGKYF